MTLASRIEELKRLEKLASVAPWTGDELECCAPEHPTLVKHATRLVWAEDYPMREYDFNLITAARNILPELLDYVEKLEKEIEELKR